MKTHRGIVVLVLGIASLAIWMIGPVLGIMAWVMGTRDLAAMEAGQMDPAGKNLTSSGRLLGMIGTFVSLFLFVVSIGWMILFFTVLLPKFPGPGSPAPSGAAVTH